MFNIIARRTLLDYCQLYPQAANALKHWYIDLQEREFTNFNELKATFGNVSVVADDRVVFNIMGNKYRMVVRMVFDYKTIQIKWFGTHTEYDKVAVSTVQYHKQ
ncbi:type II toxin-antitoxin system HigB family toxin [uncultured Fibrella sp.]|uniref:type II toxin-antitoxin system HigB family toxin n=1 Tax=uncultured Fibrella sp. TaxID=1284596 RepID=UPI0035CBC795